MAKAAGTSDRMLIYHFGNKERLISDVLAHIADVYAAALDESFGGEPCKSREECLQRILGHTGNTAMEPFIALWWEIVAGCARGHAGHREAAQAIMTRLLTWLEAHMPPDDPDPQGGARYLLTLIEGTQMLSAIGQEEIALDGLAASGL
ncbi:TetR/AcrR family transcriptional regulator [Altererythrobacter sp. GH1-8]|uniref:TetR/AcrR family transcriptional regulator n=1 Tax=Altererythrobacter sp. GH1-8 TaxID=3349333 RepID=UPI00374D49B0